MPALNIFEKEFDEGTKLKLKIYQLYLTGWLPVFLSKAKIIWPKVQIFDFFAGKGLDISGHKGSPLITIDTVNSYANLVKDKKVAVHLLFNDSDPSHVEALRENVCASNPGSDYTYEITNRTFKDVLEEKYPLMKGAANFLFLDQNGIKQIDKDTFTKITSLPQTDFLFFISSGYFKRFAKTSEFSRHFPTLNADEIADSNYYHVHRKILEYYKSLIPEGKQYFLAPFSIKKGKNIYGLIFGSGHTLGIEKFLSIAWKLDSLTGESNYDIDDDRIRDRPPSLFQEFDVPKKIPLFEQLLTDRIMNGTLTTNREVYLFTLNEGFQLKVANNIMRKLQLEKKIHDGFRMVSEKIHKIEAESIKLCK